MLATLAIIVWHFYHVIFDPDVYPVNFALVDGRVSEEWLKEEHELAFEQMRERETPAESAETETEISDEAVAGKSVKESESAEPTTA